MADNNITSDIIKGIIIGAFLLVIFARPSQAQQYPYPYLPEQYGFMEQQHIWE